MTAFETLAFWRGRILLILLAPLALCAFLGWTFTAAPALIESSDLDALSIHAYRDWQSTQVYVNQKQTVNVRAQGEWLYTPGEWHDANGHRRFRAPTFYPLPGAAGGVLIGKIGETGKPFLVGANRTWHAAESGMLYLRIDDDILSDNEGDVRVEVEIRD